MKVLVANAELEFLIGEVDLLASRFPITVVSAARRKVTVLKAIPEYRDLTKWKSLGFAPIDGERGTVLVAKDWRMHLRNEPSNEEESAIAITRLDNDNQN